MASSPKRPGWLGRAALAGFATFTAVSACGPGTTPDRPRPTLPAPAPAVPAPAPLGPPRPFVAAPSPAGV